MPGTRIRGSFAAALLGAACAALFATGCGGDDGEDSPEPPALEADAVAAIAGVEAQISQAEYDEAFEQAAVAAGFKRPPTPGDEGYEQLNSFVMGNLLQTAWLDAEAAEEGIEISQEEIDAKLAEIQESAFEDRNEFEQALVEGSFCSEDELAAGLAGCDAASEEARFLLLGEQLLGVEEASSEQIEAYYEENIESFEHAELRDVRIVLNEDERVAAEALGRLEADDSEQSWDRVAAELSQDQASKGRGGLLDDVAEDRGDPDFTDPVFAAAEGELIGPIETNRGFVVAQVTDIQEAGTYELDDELRESLRPEVEAELSFDAQEELVEKWTVRTVCAEDHVVDLCSNSDG